MEMLHVLKGRNMKDLEGHIWADEAASMHPDVSFMFQYWKSRAGAAILPSRSDIDPLDFWKHIPRVWMLDVSTGDPYRFLVRLYGTEIVEKAGVDKTGKYLDEFQGDFIETVGYRRICQVIEQKKPIWFRGQSSHLQTKYVKNIETLNCPLSSDGKNVDVIFGYTVVNFSERHNLSS